MGGSEVKVTVNMVNPPAGVSTDEVQTYFKGIGEHLEVLWVKNVPESGSVQVEISGLTMQELERLQKKKHRIKQQDITLEILHHQPSKGPPRQQEPLQKLLQEPRQQLVQLPDGAGATVAVGPLISNMLEVSGLPHDVDVEFLGMYFESPKSGGRSGAVEECTVVGKGTAHVRFQSPEVAAQVLSKSDHRLRGSPLQLKYASVLKEDASEMHERNKLFIPNVPSGVDKDYLELFLEKALQCQEESFSIEMSGGSALVTFSKDKPSKELAEMVTKIGSRALRGVHMQAELCHISTSIRVSNISDHYDEEFIELYFDNPKRSGGQDVVSVDLLGNGEAVVTFKDTEVIETILSRTHSTFGASAIITREDPFRVLPKQTGPMTVVSPDSPDPSSPASVTPVTHTPLQPSEIKIDPLVAKCIRKNPNDLESSVQSLCVQLTVDEKQGIIQIHPTKHTRSGWQQECNQCITSYIQLTFTKTQIDIPKEASAEIMSFLLHIQEESTMAFALSSNDTVLTAAGDPNTISMLQTRVEEIRSSLVQTEEELQLSSEEDYVFISQLKEEKLASMHQKLKIRCNPENQAISLKGSIRDVNQFKQCLPEYVSHTTIPVQLDPMIIRYLYTNDGKQQLNKFIKVKQCLHVVAVHFKPSPHALELHFLFDQSDAESAKTASEALQKATCTEAHKLSESFLSMLPELEEYQEQCQDLETQMHVKIVTTNKQVIIAGFREGVSHSSQALVEFIKEKSNVVKAIEIERGVWRLFQGPMQAKWGQINTQCAQNEVKLTPPEDDGRKLTVLLKGERIPIEKVYHSLTNLITSVASGSISLSRPGIFKHFQENDEMKMTLRGIETEEKVCIEIVEVDDAADNSELAETIDDSVSSKFTKVCMAHAQGMKQIVIYVGDITEFPKADVIVNAANGDLEHVGGVAKAIADKGGPVIQNDSRKHVRKSGRLDDGDALLMNQVGNLPYKALIHAVGPKWKGGHHKEEALLSKACSQSLQKAKKKYRSIAFPAISSGVYGFPLNLCADILVKTVVDFCANNPLAELQEINFILFKQGDAQAFVNAIQKHLPPENIASTKPAASVVSPLSTSETPTRRKSKPKPAASAFTTECIKLSKGSLLDVQVDVYVNTTNCNLDLSHGAVAQALSKAAGPTLQADCSKKAPISVGSLAVTGPGNLPCRHVFHVVAPSYDKPGGEAEKILRKLVRKCMKECSKRGVTSIAFPALGAGNLHFPSNVVAKIMVEEISSFLSANKSTSLRAVHLVIFMADTHRAFQQELGGTSTPVKPGRRSRSPVRTAPTSYTGASPQSRSSGLNLTLGSLQVQVVSGDITDDTSDAVVNTTNAMLSLQGTGVAGALLRKGGPELQRLCDEVIAQGKHLQEGRVISTLATGNLKCQSIFHVTLESVDPNKFLKTISACLKKAEELKYRSIAFPAIGTGVHGYSPEDAARGMIRAIQQFVSSKPKHVKTLRIVLFQSHVHQAFVRVFQDPEAASQPGMFRRAFDYMGSLLPWGSSAEEEVPSASNEDIELEVLNKELELKIYGETQQSVERAEKTLNKIIDDQFTTEKVEDANIDSLPASEVAKLEAKSRKMQVEMEINCAPLNYIRLKGKKTDVHQMRLCVHEALAAYEKWVSKQREAEQLQKLIQWKRLDSQEVEEDYDLEANYEIEQAYRQEAKGKYTCQTPSESYTIDFQTMSDVDHFTQDTSKVMRVDLVERLRQGDRPAHWDKMPTDASGKEVPVHIVDLAPGTEEYKKVLKEFNKTMPVPLVAGPIPALGKAIPVYGAGSYSKIVKIQRIQSPGQYAQYMAKKKEMDKQNPPGHQNERHLFHGTQPDTCSKVNLQGFNRSFAGAHATAYGRGVYFARDASYSSRGTYSPPDASGYKYMYLAKVLTGEYCPGNSSMIVPPAKDPQKDPNILFDSVVDSVTNPSIFVVFPDAHTYPEYLIVFC